MPDERNKLFLFEALELRNEYKSRINALRACLPEFRKGSDRFSLSRSDDKRIQVSPEFDVKSAREQLKTLEHKMRKINAAVQKANFEHHIEHGDDRVTLSEALEIRKRMNTLVGELHSQVVSASVQHVIYKEDRDIVEPNELSYLETEQELNRARLGFRELNRKIRQASFTVVIDFLDEK